MHILAWKAIDRVRTIGNIGAHMEMDVNVIVDVESEEAGQLIWLIENLMQDWYMDRHECEERLKAIDRAATDKNEAKKATGGPPT